MYGLAAIPLGGYNRFVEGEKEDGSPVDDSLDAQSLWKRFIVIFSGSLMNILFGILIIATVYITTGYFVPTNEIEKVLKNTPAAEIGLKQGDKIVELNGKKVSEWSEISKVLKKNPHKEIKVSVNRDGKIKDLIVKLTEEGGEGFLGVQFHYKQLKVNPFMAFIYAIKDLPFYILQILGLLVLVFTGKLGPFYSQLVSPIGIVIESAKIASQNFVDYMGLLLFITIQLAFLNLLPLPPLDGGRLFIIFIELIIRRPLQKAVEKKIIFYIQVAVISLLLTLFMYAFAQDLNRYLLQGGILPG